MLPPWFQPWKQKGEEPAKGDTVHSQPRNDDSDVEMENDNGSQRAGGNADSSPITQAESEEDGRLRNVEAIYRDQHLMDCTIRVSARAESALSPDRWLALIVVVGSP